MKTYLKPKYIPLVQKPCCCNVTCLQMILYRRGFGLYDQQDMAVYFDIKVGKNDRQSFNVKLGTYTKTVYDEGLKTIESEKIINRFFAKNKIPLTAHAVRGSEIKNLVNFIIENIQNGNDLWVEYKSHQIHKERCIHDNVVEGIEKRGGKTLVTLVDPAPEHKPRLQISLSALKTAISDKFARETGFIVISAKNSSDLR